MHAGNADDTNGFGGVADEFRISSTEVTNNQYVEFLNAIAQSDPNGVWNSNMDITRSGSDGSYAYTPTAGFGANPINQANFFDAMRFINWIENGQPTGAQGAGTTETGTYNEIDDGFSETRAGGATYFLPSEDEWYKAAYYDGAGGYDLYPTQSGTAPTAENVPGGTNSANYANAVGGTTAVGSYSNTTSFYGGYDFGGNVIEWTEGVSGTDRIIRGGSYLTAAANLEKTLRTAVNPGGGSFEGGVGFRVAGLITAPEDSSGGGGGGPFGNIPEPSRAVLLLLGVFAVLLRRKR